MGDRNVRFSLNGWRWDRDEASSGWSPDSFDVDWLVEMVCRAEAEALERPHIVVYLSVETGVMTCTGPFPDALSALRAAQEQLSAGGQPPTQTTVVELLPPT